MPQTFTTYLINYYYYFLFTSMAIMAKLGAVPANIINLVPLISFTRASATSFYQRHFYPQSCSSAMLHYAAPGIILRMPAYLRHIPQHHAVRAMVVTRDFTICRPAFMPCRHQAHGPAYIDDDFRAEILRLYTGRKGKISMTLEF